MGVDPCRWNRVGQGLTIAMQTCGAVWFVSIVLTEEVCNVVYTE